MAHRSNWFPYVLIHLVPFIYFGKLDSVYAYDTGLDAGQIFNFFIDTATTFTELNSKLNSHNNQTNIFKHFLKNKQLSFLSDDQLNMLDTIKSTIGKDLFKITSDLLNRFSGNQLDNDEKSKNFEEFGGELIEEGRGKSKKKKMLMKYLVGLKVVTVGVILPLLLGITLFASWKGITISLMALLMAVIIGLKNLVHAKHEPQHVVVASIPAHQHWWRKSEGPEVSWESPHELAYSGQR